MYTNCDVISCELVAPDLYKLQLRPHQQHDFAAGQYLMVVMGEKDLRPFSIASAPQQNQVIELHIGANPDNPYAWQVVQQAQESGALLVSYPHGDAQLRAGERPLLLIAGGTGFSYVNSMLEYLREANSQRPVLLYWGARAAKHLYDNTRLTQLAAQLPWLDYRPVVAEDANWQGRQGLLLDVIEAEVAELAAYDIYIAGRFDMAKVARERFAAKGVDTKQQLFGDAFAFI